MSRVVRPPFHGPKRLVVIPPDRYSWWGDIHLRADTFKMNAQREGTFVANVLVCVTYISSRELANKKKGFDFSFLQISLCFVYVLKQKP